MIKMNIPVIFQFLKDLSANNNREWFNEHKAEYETARAEFDNFLATVIARISLFDETIRGIQPKDCTYRIYRDTRFSADKTPYKIHFGGYINAKGKKSDHCGYYVHLQPDGSMLAGGSLCLPSNILKAVRQSIYNRAGKRSSAPRSQTCDPCTPTAGHSCNPPHPPRCSHPHSERSYRHRGFLPSGPASGTKQHPP